MGWAGDFTQWGLGKMGVDPNGWASWGAGKTADLASDVGGAMMGATPWGLAYNGASGAYDVYNAWTTPGSTWADVGMAAGWGVAGMIPGVRASSEAAKVFGSVPRGVLFSGSVAHGVENATLKEGVKGGIIQESSTDAVKAAGQWWNSPSSTEATPSMGTPSYDAMGNFTGYTDTPSTDTDASNGNYGAFGANENGWSSNYGSGAGELGSGSIDSQGGSAFGFNDYGSGWGSTDAGSSSTNSTNSGDYGAFGTNENGWSSGYSSDAGELGTGSIDSGGGSAFGFDSYGSGFGAAEASDTSGANTTGTWGSDGSWGSSTTDSIGGGWDSSSEQGADTGGGDYGGEW